MKINLRTITIIVCLLLLIVVAARSEALAQDPNQPDSLLLDSVVAYTRGTASMPIRFFNDEELSGIEITLRHSSSDMFIDSVSWAGSRLASVPTKNYRLFTDSTLTVYALVTEPPLIPPGNGLLTTLHYSYPASIDPQIITLDTVTVRIDMREWSTTFKPDLNNPFAPYVRRGYLDIQDSPFVMDSIWLADVQTHPGEQITVDVGLYNERNIKRVLVALAFDPTYLTVDSASYVGTRGIVAGSKNFQRNNSFGKLLAQLEFGEASPLEPGTGTLFRLHFSVDPGAGEATTLIDSTTYFSTGNTFIELTSFDENEQFTPFFSPGFVHITLPTDVDDITDDDNLPTDYHLAQNYPNPFNPSTTIEFALPRAGKVKLEVFNILGQHVRTLVDRQVPAGQHQIEFDGRSKSGNMLASGVYFYRLASDEFTQSRKMVLVK